MHAEVIRHNRLLSGQGPGMRSWIGSSPIPNLTNSTQQAHMNDQWVITTLLAEAKVGPCRMGTIRKMTQLGAPESDLKVNAFGDIKREFGRETVESFVFLGQKVVEKCPNLEIKHLLIALFSSTLSLCPMPSANAGIVRHARK